MYCKGYWVIISPKERNDSPDLCLEDSGSYSLWLWIKSHWLHTKRAGYWNPCAGGHLGPWFMESFPFFLLTIHGAPCDRQVVWSLLKVSCPSRPQQHHVSTSWAKGNMTATSVLCLTSKVKYFFKFLMIITSGRAEQPTNRTPNNDKAPKYTDGFKPTGNIICIICSWGIIISIVHRTYLKPLSAWVMTAMRSLDGPRFRGFRLQICDMTSQMGSMG